MYPARIATRFIYAATLFLCVSSFSIFSDTSTQAQIANTGGDTPMAITIVFYDEWEPGLQRQIRQISIDGDGHGQVATRTDDLVTNIGTFDYQPDELEAWSSKTVSDLSDAYLSTELEDQGLIVEGNPTSYKFFFSWSGQVKIIDAEPAYEMTPVILISLAKQLQTYTQTSNSQFLHKQYLAAVPLGPQQSAEILQLFGSLPDIDRVRQLLNESDRVALDIPVWLTNLQETTRQKIRDAFDIDAGINFLYVKSQTGSVTKMEFVAAKPTGR
jgi:hypothetical protein